MGRARRRTAHAPTTTTIAPSDGAQREVWARDAEASLVALESAHKRDDHGRSASARGRRRTVTIRYNNNAEWQEWSRRESNPRPLECHVSPDVRRPATT